MKPSLSTAILSVVLIAVLVLSAVNTIWIFESRDQINQFMSNSSTYDYVIFEESGIIKARSGITGQIDYSSHDASYVINSAMTNASNIYIKQDTYTITSDIELYNKKYAQIISNGAIFNCSGQKIIIRGDTYDNSRNNLISGLDILNGTIRIDDSFKTTITSVTIEDSAVGLEFASTNSWSEGTKIEDTYFIRCNQSIVFRSPGDGVNATASYANTEIVRCYFNLVDNSVGIVVEPEAQFSDSLMENVRMWICENSNHTNQTGILMRGTMKQTLLSNVVFESFLNTEITPNYQAIYAINLDTNHLNHSAPTLAGGNSFLGTFSNRIYNPNGKWIYGLGGLFKIEDIQIEIGKNGTFGNPEFVHDYPLTMADFQARINVTGLGSNEVITVKLDFEYIDHTTLNGIEKTFTTDSAVWLDASDIFAQYPSQNVLWAVIVTAKTNQATTNTQVTLDVYGATT